MDSHHQSWEGPDRWFPTNGAFLVLCYFSHCWFAVEHVKGDDWSTWRTMKSGLVMVFHLLHNHPGNVVLLHDFNEITNDIMVYFKFCILLIECVWFKFCVIFKWICCCSTCFRFVLCLQLHWMTTNYLLTLAFMFPAFSMPAMMSFLPSAPSYSLVLFRFLTTMSMVSCFSSPPVCSSLPDPHTAFLRRFRPQCPRSHSSPQLSLRLSPTTSPLVQPWFLFIPSLWMKSNHLPRHQ